MLTLPGFNFAHDILSANHALIGGCTGSGKSNLLNCILYTLTGYNPENNQCIIIDLKRIDFTQWQKFPHIAKIIKDPKTVNAYLDLVISEMYDRYSEMERNETKICNRYTLYLIIDEINQVTQIPGTIERLTELTRLARASDIHLILAGQNNSRNVKQGGLPACIQQNITCSVGLRCKNKIESRQIIGQAGCEALPKYGKAIISEGIETNIIDIPFITEDDIKQRYIDTMNYYGKEMQLC